MLRRALRGPGYLLAVVEGLFVGQGLTLTPGFVPLFTRTLGPRRLARVDFQRAERARALLNAWVQEQTQGETLGGSAGGCLDSWVPWEWGCWVPGRLGPPPLQKGTPGAPLSPQGGSGGCCPLVR